jgi:hypothetical protein
MWTADREHRRFVVRRSGVHHRDGFCHRDSGLHDPHVFATGLDGLIKWIKKNDENRSAFYTRMYIRLLPVNLDIRSHKDVVYHSARDIQERFGQAGMSLELIERLRKEEAEQPKLIEHVRVD